MELPITIYTISDQNTGLVYYIGATVQPLHKRLQSHIKNYSFSPVRSLPINHVIEPLEVVNTVHDATNAERFWIDQMKAWGFPIMNSKYSNPYRGRRKVAA